MPSAYLEKKILVTIPVTEAHKTYLEKQASSGKYNCQFRYIPKEHVTKEDLEDTQVLIGNLPLPWCGRRSAWNGSS